MKKTKLTQAQAFQRCKKTWRDYVQFKVWIATVAERKKDRLYRRWQRAADRANRILAKDTYQIWQEKGKGRAV